MKLKKGCKGGGKRKIMLNHKEKYMKKLLMAVAALSLFAHGASADPRDLTYKSVDELPAFGGSPATGDLELIFDASEGKFKTRSAALPSGNPLVLLDSYTIAEVNASAVVLSSATGSSYYLHDFSVYSSGNMGGLTAVVVECTSNGTDIISIPAASLTNGTVISRNSANVTFGSASINGCPSGSGVQITKTGSTGTGSSEVFGVFDYFAQ